MCEPTIEWLACHSIWRRFRDRRAKVNSNYAFDSHRPFARQPTLPFDSIPRALIFVPDFHRVIASPARRWKLPLGSSSASGRSKSIQIQMQMQILKLKVKLQKWRSEGKSQSTPLCGASLPCWRLESKSFPIIMWPLDSRSLDHNNGTGSLLFERSQFISLAHNDRRSLPLPIFWPMIERARSDGRRQTGAITITIISIIRRAAHPPTPIPRSLETNERWAPLRPVISAGGLCCVCLAGSFTCHKEPAHVGRVLSRFWRPAKP